MRLNSIVESLIFVADKPITLRTLAQVTGATNDKLKDAIAEVREQRAETGIHLVEVSGGYLFRTNPDNANWVKKLLSGRPQRLTRPMLETLAIIAYRQPVTRPEMEDIRGVDCGGTLRVLLERELVRIVGKKEEPGRPILYGTTKFFLEFFNLKSLRELPTLKEFTELSEEHAQKVDEQFGGGPAMVIDQDELEEGEQTVEAASETEAGDEAVEATSETEAGEETIEATSETEAGDEAVEATSETEAGDEAVEAASETEAGEETVEATSETEAGEEAVEATSEAEATEGSTEASSEIPAAEPLEAAESEASEVEVVAAPAPPDKPTKTQAELDAEADRELAALDRAIDQADEILSRA